MEPNYTKVSLFSYDVRDMCTLEKVKQYEDVQPFCLVVGWCEFYSVKQPEAYSYTAPSKSPKSSLRIELTKSGFVRVFHLVE